LVRYIHLNPLRARLVADYKNLGKFKYTGHSALRACNKITCAIQSSIL
jgi:hypothetical protein